MKFFLKKTKWTTPFLYFCKILLIASTVLAMLSQPVIAALAASTLTITPITWNVIGLDSNSPATGPYRFPVGARVCSSVATTNVTVNLVWDSTNTNIDFRPGSLTSITIPSLAAGGCSDAYFEVQINQVAGAYDTTRRYHITATDTSGTVSTPTPRELYVEHLISQNRNGITDIKLNGTSIPAGGTMTLMVGNTYTIELDGFTATQGYNQLESFINFPNTIFQVLSVSTTYSSDNSPYVSNPNSKLYSDACLWDNDPGSPTYRSCLGGDYKAGGTVVTTYTVKIISGAGTSQTLNTLLYDFSGSSYHYNNDFSTGYRIASIIGPSTITIQKAFSPKAITPGGTSVMSFTLSNPTTLTITGVNFSDSLPSGLVVAGTPNVSYSGCGVGGAFSPTLAGGETSVSFANGTLSPNSVCTINVTVTAASAGTYANTTGHLFINTSTDTGNTGSDTLTASSAPACISGQVLAQWSFPSGSSASNPTPDSGALVTTSASTTTTSTTIDTGNGNPVPSWSGQGFAKTGTITGDSSPYFQFRIDNGGTYSSLQISLDYRHDANWDGSGTTHTYIWSSTTGAAGSFGATPIYSATTTDVAFHSTGNINAAATGSSSTYFRINSVGANNTNSNLEIDNVKVTGCGVPAPAPTISKSFSPNPVVKGSTSTLTFTLSNTAAGNQALTGIAFTDVLPSGLSISDTSTSQCNGGTLTTTASTRTIALTGGTLAAGASCTLSVTITGTTEGSYNNVTGYVSSTQSGTSTNYATASLTVIAPPAIEKSFSPASILVGNTSSATFTITNPNRSNSLSGIGFTDVFPSTGSGATGNMTYSSTTSNTCGGSLTNNSNGTLTAGDPGIKLSGVTLSANSSCSITVVVTVTDSSSSPSGYVNTTTAVTSTEGGNGNTGSATLDVSNPVSLIGLNKQVSTDDTNWYKYVGIVPSPTAQVWYKFTVSNDGETTLNNIAVSDPSYNSYLSTNCTAAGKPFVAPFSLAAGTSASCVIGPISVTSAPSPNPYANTATVTNTTYTPTTPVTSTAKYGTESMTIAKSVTESYYTAAGNTLHYSYLVTNNGGYPLLGPVTVTDDKITTPNSVSCPDLFTTLGTDYLNPGQSITCTATYTVTSADVTALSITNHASATAGGVTSNTDTKTVPLAPDLTVTKSNDVSGSIPLSNTFHWTLTVNNSATAGPASFVSPQTILQDDLPTSGISSYSVGSITPSGVTNPSNISCSITSNTLKCAATGAVTISTGGSFSVPITVTPNAAGSLVNPRSGGTCAVDPAPGVITELDETNNNCATNTVTVVAPPVVTKSFSPTPIGVGGTSTMTITIQNPAANTVALTGVAFTDNLPSGMQVASTPSASNNCGGTLTATGGASSVSLSGGSIAINTTCTITVSVTATTAGDKTNTVTVTTTNGGNSNTASADLAVADATKTIASTSESSTGFVNGYERVAIGEIVRYHLVTQLPQGTSTNFQFRDNIPTGLQYLNDNTTKVALVCSSGTTCASSSTLSDPSFVITGTSSSTPTYVLPGSAITLSSGNPTFSFGNLNNTDTVNPVYVVLEFNAVVLNTSSNVITAATRNNNYAVWINNSSIVTSNDVGVRISEPSITNLVKAVSPASGPYSPGDTITYTLTYSNTSTAITGATAFDVYTIDALDSNLDLQSVNVTTPTGSTVTDTSTTGVGGVVRIKVDQVAPAVNISSGPTGVTITVTAKIISTAPAGQVISNSANLTYTSLPGGVTTGDANGTCPNATGSCTPGTSGSGTGERNGADGVSGLNDYVDSASATSLTVSRPDLRVTKDDGTTTYLPGSNLTYTITVYNDGNITATGTVTDNFPAALTNISWTCTGSVLAATCGASGNTNINDSVSIPAGEHVTYTVNTTVASNATGDLSNIASAALGGSYTDPTPSNNSATDTDTSAAAPSLTVKKSSTTTSISATGVVNYSYLVTNTGNVTVTGISVADNNIDTGTMSCPSTSLAVSSNMTCTAQHTVTQAELDANGSPTAGSGNLTNTVTVTSTNASTVTDTLNIPISQSPTLTVKKSSTTTSISTTGIVNYSYLVTNTGNTTVTGISVADNNIDSGTMSCPSTSLAVGANMTCTAQHTVTQAELNAGGNLTNTVTVTSTNAPIITDTLNIPITQSPALTVKKSSTTTSISATGVVSYSYLVTNTGNVTVTGISAADNNIDSGTMSCPSTSLAVSSNMTCTAQHTVTQAELNAGGNLTNTVTVTSTNASTVTDTLNIPFSQNPALTVKKSSTTTSISATGVVNYSYLVTNTGNVTVTGINVADNNIDGGTMSCPSTSLAVSSNMTCTAQHTVTQAELDANGSPTAGSGNLTNTVTVTSTNAPTVTDTLNIPITQSPALTVKKSSITTSISATGAVNYSYLVTNTGNVTVTGISVADNNIDSGTMSCPSTSLAVGANMTCTAQHTVTQTELDAGGNLTNTVTVTSTNASTVTDTLNIPINQNTSLGLTKSANPTVFTVSGQTISYTYTLTNNGNVSLTSPYTITDDKVAGANISCASATSPLAPGVSTTCTGTYTTSTGDVSAGSLTNTASATAKFGSTDVNSSTAQATINLAALSLTKSASPSTYSNVGDTINYSYLLKNTGNATLSSPFTVTDNKTSVTCPSTPTSLAPGDSITCTATYAIVQADLTNGSLTNQATAHAKFGSNTIDSNQDTATVNSQAGSLTGTVFNDTNTNGTQDSGETGISGVTIKVYDSSTNLIATTTTDASGHYSVLNLPPATYTVVEQDLNGYVSSTSNNVSVTVPSNGSAQADFGDYQLSSTNTNSISGIVFNDANSNGSFDSGEQVIAGVTITLYDQNNNVVATTTTAANGSYSFNNLSAGVYNVVETNPSGYISTTLDHVGVTLNSGTNAVVNYGDKQSSATIIDPAVTKFGDPSNAQIGDLVTYTITVGNNGNTNASNVVLTDTKPAFLDIISVNVSPNKNFTVNISGNTFTINFGTVTPTDFYTVTVLTRVNSLGQAPGGANNASITTSSANDPTFNDAASATLTIPSSSTGGSATTKASVLPRTGFAPGIITTIAPKPANIYNASSDLTIEIPALGVKTSIVGVPQSGNTWDVTWLGNQVGYLDGTAFPTWSGNSVLTGHVYGASGLPGPFVNLHTLKWGDQIIIHFAGQRYIYQVRENNVVSPNDTSAFKHENQPWITLITCKDYNASTNTYAHRVEVGAVLVQVVPDTGLSGGH